MRQQLLEVRLTILCLSVLIGNYLQIIKKPLKPNISEFKTMVVQNQDIAMRINTIITKFKAWGVFL